MDTNPDTGFIENSLDGLMNDLNKPVEEEAQPTYKMVGSAKIPVSKATGKLWESRKNFVAGIRSKDNGVAAAWKDAISYYMNDQMGHRNSNTFTSGNVSIAKTSAHTTTENIVFSNITTLIPALYAKNPDCEISANDPAQEDMATTLEKLVNILAARKYNGGFNLKPKVRRAVMMACLTNKAYLEVRYIKREHSNEAHLKDIEDLSAKLKDAKSKAEIIAIEGELQALEEKASILQPAGPAVMYRAPHDVFVDPNAMEEDLSDAKWIMCREYLPTSYINAQYAIEDESGDYKSIYDPTHSLKEVSNEEDTQSVYSLIQPKDEQDKLDKNGRRVNQKDLTEVWYVWDKSTRRVFLFNDSCWKWPLWVWDDPYNLEGFFPFVALSFYQNPFGGESKGEVTYYLDQQDNINEINSAKQQALNALRRKVIYNKDLMQQEDVLRLLNESDETAVGVSLPEGMKISDVFSTMVPPAVQYPQLFDKGDQYNAIARISSTKSAMTGDQYKTNTTNEAIANYNQASDTRLEEKTDLIEDMIGEVCWKVIQLCLQFMDQAQVSAILGTTAAQSWRNLNAEEIRSTFSLQVVGGSSTKPTSRAKKQMAMELGQVLGQFAGKLPMVGVVMLKVMERAFNEVVITKDEWQAINDSAEKAMSGESDLAKADQMLQQMPDNARMAFAQAVAQGAPIEQALQQIVETLKQKEPNNG